jgi:Rrf2 family protein
MSQGVEWGLHACLNLAWAGGTPVPSARLAALNDLSPTSMNKVLQHLARAGLVRSLSGPSGGFVLARPPAEVTVLEVVEAVEGTAGAFRCTEIRGRGPLATVDPTGPCAIAATMAAAEAAWRDVLAATTVADLASRVDATADEVAVTVGAYLRS